MAVCLRDRPGLHLLLPGELIACSCFSQAQIILRGRRTHQPGARAPGAGARAPTRILSNSTSWPSDPAQSESFIPPANSADTNLRECASKARTIAFPSFPRLPGRRQQVMLQRIEGRRQAMCLSARCPGILVALALVAGPGRAQEPPPPLTLDAAIRLGLERNPELMAFRQQRGVAEGSV